MIEPRLLDFSADAMTVARRLLGQRLVRVVDGERRSGIIIETEAYLGVHDRASHAYAGRRTPRVESMYLPGGHAYVYRIYGLHTCFNVVCGAADEPAAVLIRAIQPEEGLVTMRAARGGVPDHRLCSGPGALCQTMGIDRTCDGANLTTHPAIAIERLRKRAVAKRHVLQTPRIGLGNAQEWREACLRFVLQVPGRE